MSYDDENDDASWRASRKLILYQLTLNTESIKNLEATINALIQAGAQRAGRDMANHKWTAGISAVISTIISVVAALWRQH